MAKKIQMFRVKENRADKLREKAIELMIKSKEMVKESDLINYLIDEFTDKLDIDKDGFFIKEDND